MTVHYRWSATVESAEVDGSWLIMNPESMTMTKLDNVSAHVWSQLRWARSLGDLVNEVVNEYDVTPDIALCDVQNLLAELVRIEIVEEDDQTGNAERTG